MSKSEIWRELKLLAQGDQHSTWRTSKAEMLRELEDVREIIELEPQPIEGTFITYLDIKVIPYKPSENNIEIMDNEIKHGMTFRTSKNPLVDMKTRRSILKSINKDFYFKTFIIDANSRMSVQDMYNNRYNLPLPEFVVRQVQPTDDFKGIILQNGTPPEYSSLGVNSAVWNNVKNECALNGIIAYLRGTCGFKNITRDSILDTLKIYNRVIRVGDIQRYAMIRSVPMYMIDGTDNLVWKHTPERDHTNEHKAFVCKVNNGHLYPITSKDMKNEIIYGNIKIPKVNWVDHEYLGLMSENDELPLGKVNLISGFRQVQGHGESSWEITQNNLNYIARDILRTKNILVENLSCDSEGNIIKFSYLDQWFILSKDYELIQKVLTTTRTLPEFQSDTMQQRFTYKGQSLQRITRDIIEVFKQIPQSQINTQTFEELNHYNQGAYNESYCDKKVRNAVTKDIRRCYTSILYNRKHPFPILSPQDEIRPYRGEIIPGSKYFIEGLQLGLINLGDGFYDSEFVENMIDNKLIDSKQILRELVPWQTIPNDFFRDIIDLIYNNYDDSIAKHMINKFIGTLNLSGNSVKDVWLTMDPLQRDTWINEKLTRIFKDFHNGFLCYDKVQSTPIESNMPIFYSIVDMSYWKLWEMTQVVNPKEILKYHSDSITFIPQMDTPARILRYNSNIMGKGLGKIRDSVLDLPRAICPKELVEGFEPIFKEMKVLRDPEELPKGNLLITGGAGRGKSYTIVNKLIPTLDKYVVLSTSHKALQNLRDIGVEASKTKTLRSFFYPPIGMTQDQHIKKISKSDISIIIDEFTMTGQAYMNMIYKLYKLGAHIICVGDPKQIPSVDKRMIKYSDFSFFREMFDHHIILTINYRFDPELDKLALKAYSGMFKFDRVKECKLNLCYKNNTRHRINKLWSDRNLTGIIGNKGYRYLVGTPVICNVNKPNKGLLNNKTFEISKITKSEVKLTNLESPLSVEDFTKYIEMAHAITIHKSQGSTLEGEIAIHDIADMSRELVYTALTRLTSIDNLYVPKPINISNIRPEKFYNTWKPESFKKGKSIGYIYELVIEGKTQYIGSTLNLNKQEQYHRDNISTGTAPLYKYLREHKLDFKMNIVKSISFLDEQQLRTAEMGFINNFDGELLNSGKIVLKKKELKLGEYAPVQKQKARGCIMETKEGVVFKYSINGSKKRKKFRVGKKRTLKQALELAKEFQAKIYI